MPANRIWWKKAGQPVRLGSVGIRDRYGTINRKASAMTTPECCTSSDGKKCCPCKKMPGLFLLLFGLTFLLRETDCLSAHTAAIAWPVIVMLAGLQFLLRDCCPCCKTEKK